MDHLALGPLRPVSIRGRDWRLSDLYSEYSVMTFQVNHGTGASDFLGETPFHGQDTMAIHFTATTSTRSMRTTMSTLVAGNKTLRLLGMRRMPDSTATTWTPIR